MNRSLMRIAPAATLAMAVGDIDPLSSPALPTVLGGVGLSVNQTLQRTIARGCATALDAPDDTNSSDNDFSLVPMPNPRGNSLVASETLCTGTPPTTPATPTNAAPAKAKCKKKKKHHSADAAKKKKCKKKKA